MSDLPAHVTTETLWRGAALLAALDVVAVPLTSWLVPAPLFRASRGRIAVASALFWAALWLWVVTVYWFAVYRFVFPAWSRWLLPAFMGALFFLAAHLCHALAVRSRSAPTVVFLLLGATLGPLTHVVAVARGIVERPPVLRGASPFAAVVVSWPEYLLYWCVILLTARAFSARSTLNMKHP